MREIVLFRILRDRDRVEGKNGLEYTNLAFTYRKDALKVIKDPRWYKANGVMDTPGNAHNICEEKITVYDSFEEWAKIVPEDEKSKLRRQALEKLTPEERLALGVSGDEL